MMDEDGWSETAGSGAIGWGWGGGGGGGPGLDHMPGLGARDEAGAWVGGLGLGLRLPLALARERVRPSLSLPPEIDNLPLSQYLPKRLSGSPRSWVCGTRHHV